jgi:hypothetical protein
MRATLAELGSRHGPVSRLRRGAHRSRRLLAICADRIRPLPRGGAGNESSFFSLAKPQTVDSEAGDIAGIGWVRYDDPETKTFKLNAERQNGRAAMLGITGCLLHELLGVDALYPTGGMGGAAPPTIF